MGRKPPHDQHAAATLLAAIADQLPDNGLDDRRRDARLLLAMALERDDAVLPHEEITVTPKQHQALDRMQLEFWANTVVQCSPAGRWIGGKASLGSLRQ